MHELLHSRIHFLNRSSNNNCSKFPAVAFFILIYLYTYNKEARKKLEMERKEEKFIMRSFFSVFTTTTCTTFKRDDRKIQEKIINKLKCKSGLSVFCYHNQYILSKLRQPAKLKTKHFSIFVFHAIFILISSTP